MKLIFVSCVSATFDLDNDCIYYASKPYDVTLNGEKVLTDVRTNIFSLFDLTPDTSYEVEVNGEKVQFKTDAVSEILSSKGIDNTGETNVTKDLQALIDSAHDGALINIEPGVYYFTSLKLRSNTTFNLKKGATLSASIDISEYEELDGEVTLPNGEVVQYGSWEGSPSKMKLSLINAIDAYNVKLVGQGTIDGRAQLGPWWIDVKNLPYVRPHILFYVQSHDIYTQGITVKNSPQWTIHPYFCQNLGYYDLYIENPKISPNTDGLDPQCCKNVDIIGVHFSVGDDCIAIKSGKMYIGQKYKTPCEKITIRNCIMQYGHGAVVLGSEMSGGIRDLVVENCIFDHTDRGLRIKTRRGRGNTAIIDDVTFKNILMKNVLSPVTVNMFYFCDPDGKTEYVWSKEKLPVDDRTPYLGKFTFENIIADDCEYTAGYFYGLPEMPIGEINIKNSTFNFKEDAGSGTPVMMTDAEVCSKRGFIFKNVHKFNIENVTMVGQDGPLYESDGTEVK